MDPQISILFLILLVFKSFSQTTGTTQHHSSINDITETLRSSIHGLFQNVDKKEKNQTESLNNFIYTYEVKLGSKTFICNMAKGKDCQSSTPNLFSNFITNEMLITVPEYSRYGNGVLRSPYVFKNKDRISYYIFPLRNVSIQMTKSSKNYSNETFSINFPSNFVTDKNNVYLSIADSYIMSLREKDDFIQPFKTVLLQLMRDEFKEYGKNMWNKLQFNTRTIFTSIYPNFFNDQQQYYYLIPNISYVCFNLKNIAIKGLTNFAWINKTNEKFHYFGNTLLVKNITGEMTLDYGSEIEKPIKLAFSADDIFIKTNLNNNCSYVEIQNYRVFQTGVNNPLTHEQSAIIIQHIESAIAKSLMPSMTVCREMNINRLNRVNIMQNQCPKKIRELLHQNDWKSIKQRLQQYVPFNQDETIVINTAHNLNTRSNLTNRPTYEYHISFENVTLKLITAIPDPKEILCEFPNNLRMVQHIKAAPVDKLRWNGDKGEGIDIKFHANFASINFSKLKQNSSSPNQSCEFQLNNNEYIKVELAQEQDTDQETELQLKKKIDTTLISIAKQFFVQNIKPMVCLPFDICNQAVKIVDDFFARFIDNVLKKCSLRRKNINN